jgi:2-(1,2-epoxy-1,2-dihydrophenyl)acetyl-CoA isomerase
MEYERLRVTRHDGVVGVTFNRPELLNAIDEQTVVELYDVLDRLPDDRDARVLLLRGAGRAFSSGGDLSSGDMAPGSDLGRFVESHFNPVLEKLYDLPLPVVSAVHGPAVGVGCSLALAADIVLATPSAYFLLAFVRVGLTPDLGATWLIPRHVGRARALGMLLLGERIIAQRAADWGLIWDCVAEEGFEAEIARITDQLAKGPTMAYAMIRRGMREALETGLTEALRRERLNQRLAGQSSDFLEGVTAFAEKRAPRFQGK